MKRLHICEYSTPKTVGEDGIIRGVKILGSKSENGRTYRRAAVSKAVPLYEGAAVFMLHPNPQEKRKGTRQLADHFGSLMNVTFKDGTDYGLFGDLAVKQSHPMAGSVLEAAPKARFGLSHNAHVEMTDDESEVTEIVQVNSVDLVDQPATTKNLFEGSHGGEEVVSTDELVERLVGVAEKLEAMAETGRKKTRFSVLERREAGDDGGDQTPPIGNTHDDFVGAMRGFPLTN